MMNQFRKITFLFVGLLIGIVAVAQNISNKGRDFWTAYGHHEYFESDNTQNMTLYLSVDELPAGVQYATVTVTLDSSKPTKALWWTRTYRIPRNTVVSIDNNDPNIFSSSPLGANGALPWGPIPKGATNTNQPASPTSINYDARLVGIRPPAGNGGDGLFKGKGIHITSDNDIVVYAHIYSQTSSGATMLLPTNSWGYTYTAINSRQLGYENYDFSYFFVVATEDSTVVKITPSANSRSGRLAGVPFTVTLNKGYVYQYISYTNPVAVPGGFAGVELTGSKIESVPNVVGKCKKIAVFCGSSRTEGENDCATGGRDNDMQQCFPEHTWGKRYATVPFCKGSGTNITPGDFKCTSYKVIAKDAGTSITVNGGAPINLPVGSVYRFNNSTPNLIVANSPIVVAQFMGGGTGGEGDPEMVYLSPLEQSISKIGCYRNTRDNINVNYINVIIPDSGVATLKIDGIGQPWGGNSSINNHPNLPGYKVVIKGWPDIKGQSIVSSNARFNIIVYGLGVAESYAYSGGAFFNNISASESVYNIQDTITNQDSINIINHGLLYDKSIANVRTNVIFQPRKIEWLFSKIDTTRASVVRVCDGVKNTNVIDTTSGGYTYVAPTGFTGLDTFYIKGCDASGGNCVAQMHVVKVGTPFSALTNIIYQVKSPAANQSGVAPNEMLPTGGIPPYNYANVDIAGTVNTLSNKKCKVIVLANGNYNYIPTPGFVGLDTFYLRVCDNSTPKNCFTQMHIIRMGAAFSGDTVVIRNANIVNTIINGNAVSEINAIGGLAPYSYQLVNSNNATTVTSSLGAAISINASTGNYIYTPNTGFTGTDTFYVKLCDASVIANCINQKHIVTIGAAFSSSIVNPIQLTTSLNKIITGFASNDLNVFGGVGAYTFSTVNNIGTVVATSNKGAAISLSTTNGKYVYTPLNNFVGIDTFYTKVCDASTTPNCATLMQIITVSNDFITDTNRIIHTIVTNVPVLGSAKTELKAVGGTPTYKYFSVNKLGTKAIATISGGVVVVDSISGVYNYTPKLNFFGLDTFYVRVCDSSVTQNCSTQMHLVFIAPGKTYSIAPNNQIDGNALVDNKLLLSNNKPYTFNNVTVTGATIGTSTRGATVSMVPGFISKIIKGNDTQYVYAAPTCNYMFLKKDPNSTKLDSVYIPIVVYTKAVNGVPAGCYGAGGLVGDTIKLLFILAPEPKATMTVARNSSCPTDLLVNFTGSTSATNFPVTQLPAIKWIWEVSGIYLGNPVIYPITSAKNVSFLFDTGTTVTSKLTTIFKNGATAVTTNSYPFTPSSIKFSATKSVCLGQLVTAIDSTISSLGKDSCSWDWGDGSPKLYDNSCNPVNHIYATAGTYTISHNVKIVGCNAPIQAVTRQVVVADKRFPVIAYPTDCLDTAGTANFSRDTSVAAGGAGTPIKKYVWKFGDIASGVLDSSKTNPTFHKYPFESVYNVKLFVEDTSGCKGDTTVAVTIKINPSIYFNALPSSVCIKGGKDTLNFSSYAGCYNQSKTLGKGVFKGTGIDTLGNFYPKIAGAGIKTIWYVYKSFYGCTDSISRQITVNDSAVVAFDYNPKAACLPKDGKVTFTNLTSGAIGTFLWNFDDVYSNASNLDTSDLIDPVHNYTNTGLHNVKLLSVSPAGCRDSLIIPITFSVTPEISYTIKSQFCENDNDKKIDSAIILNGVKGLDSIYYSSSMGVTSNGLFSPAVASWGNKVITYKYTSTANCVDSASVTILVKARPRVGYIYPVGCLPPNGIVTFQDTTKIPDGQTKKTCAWTFGDANANAGNPNFSPICSPSHIFNYGKYVVYHSVTSSLGCFSDVTDTLTFNIQPLLSYAAIPDVCENITSYSVAKGGISNPIAAPGYAIYQGVGIIDTTLGTFNPFKAGAGIHTIYYIYKATSGCVAKDSQTVKVKARPKGDFTFSPNGCLNPSGTVQFDTSGIAVAGSSITSYNWKFEGVNSPIVNGVSPTHNYNDGTDTIILNIQALNGCSFDTSKIVTFSKKPAITTLANFVKCENDPAFNYPIPVPTNGAVGSGYFMSFKNAFTDSITGKYDPSKAGYGIDTVSFRFVSNSVNQCDTIIKTTITINGKPNVFFTVNPPTGCLDVNGKVDFDASASKMNDNSTILKYDWLFENGLIAGMTVNPIYSYNDGTYKIKLTVTGINGCVGDTSITKTFSKKPALTVLPNIDTCENVAPFTIAQPTPTNGAIGSGYFMSFKNAFTDSITGKYDPSKAGYGIDTIYFKFTTNPGGCDTIIKKVITIRAKPIPAFTVSPPNSCLDVNGKVDFDASATVMNDLTGIQKYDWLFENGTKSGTGITPTHNYNDGTFNIKLTITGINGCVGDTSIPKTFSKKPALTVLPNIDTCENVAPFTIAQPTPTNGAIGSGYFRSFKNAFIDSIAGKYDPSKAGYGLDTVYFRFVSNSVNQCDTIIKTTIKINGKPNVSFAVNPPTGCLDVNGKVDFDASATVMNDLSAIQKYEWLFENPLMSGTGITPTHNYNDGTFNIKLTVTGINGCVDTTSIPKIFSKKPAITTLANFVKCQNDAAFNYPIPVPTNGAVGSGYFTSFKNAFTDSITGKYDPSKAGYGIDTVYFRFVSNSVNQCDTIIKTTIKINGKPNVSFAVNPPTGCLDVNGKVDFDASATVMNDLTGIQKYDWLFENGTKPGTGITPTHNYNDGTYNIKLTVTGINGCVDTTSIPKTFSKKPAITTLANFVKCQNDAAFNYPTPVPKNGSVGTGYFMSFKNAFIDSITGKYDPSKAGYGIDTVYFRFVSNSVNQCDTIIKTTIKINSKPEGTFAYSPKGVCLNALGTVNFTASGVTTKDNSVIQTYNWLFENGTIAATGIAPSHNYVDGIYTISLNATTVNGCVATIPSITDTFYRTPVLTNFSHIPVCENDTIFNWVAPNVTNGPIVGAGWFTSSKNAITDSLTGTYNPSLAGAGNDIITYHYQSNGRCVATKTFTLKIYAKPRNSFSIDPPNGCLEASGLVKFDATKIKATGAIITKYNWLFENGGMPGLTATPTHNYSDGIYTIKLTAITNQGCSNDFIVVDTFNRKPSIDPISIKNVCGNSNPFLLVPPNISNGVVGTGYFRSDKEAVVGSTYYPATATLGSNQDVIYYIYTSAAGNCSDSVSKTITVSPVPKPVINVKPNVCVDSVATFRSFSGIAQPANIDSLLWNFGDTIYSLNGINGTKVTRTFDTTTSIKVYLTAISDSGCRATTDTTITIRANPIAFFNFDTVVCMPLGKTYFHNLSVLPPNAGSMSYAWTFGDPSATPNNPNTSTLADPNHGYSSIGTYPVKLIVRSVPYNCTATYSDTLTGKKPFFDKPIAKFGVIKDTLCAKETAMFVDSSTAPNSSLFSYTWYYGDGSSPNTTLVPYSNYNYPAKGVYDAKLEVRNTEKCLSDLYTYPIKVVVYPQPEIEVMKEFVVLKNTFLQFNPSINDTTGMEYTWTALLPPYSLVGLSSASDLNPTLTATESQIYSLYVEGSGGCNATRIQSVKVLGSIKIPNAFSPNGDGINDTWDITSLGDYPGATLDIFDRSGIKIRSFAGNNIKWDGTKNGVQVPFGTYYYIIDPGMGQPKITGWVVVLR